MSTNSKFWRFQSLFKIIDRFFWILRIFQNVFQRFRIVTKGQKATDRKLSKIAGCRHVQLIFHYLFTTCPTFSTENERLMILKVNLPWFQDWIDILWHSNPTFFIGKGVCWCFSYQFTHSVTFRTFLFTQLASFRVMVYFEWKLSKNAKKCHKNAANEWGWKNNEVFARGKKGNNKATLPDSIFNQQQCLLAPHISSIKSVSFFVFW